MTNLHKPEMITFTGLDERTDLSHVENLSRRYGNHRLEWGVLISKKNTGHSPRYPSQPFIEKEIGGLGLSVLSAHICGEFARQIALDNVVDLHLAELLKKTGFQRTQINIGDGELMLNPLAVHGDAPGNVERFGNLTDCDPILQCRLLKFPDDKRVAWLYDVSGGIGMDTREWPTNAIDLDENVFVGYAGGLGPDNIERKIEEISRAHNSERPYWVDMETRIRTDDWLDLDKCEAVLAAVFG